MRRIVLLVVLVMLMMVDVISAQVSSAERAGLLGLYDQTGGAEWVEQARDATTDNIVYVDGFDGGGVCQWSNVVPAPDPPCRMTVMLPGDVEMDLVHIPSGTFGMGSPVDERGRYDQEDLHEVSLTQGYYMGKTEVTQGQWEAVMGTNPAHDYGVGPEYPVYYVSWDDIRGAGGFLELLKSLWESPVPSGAGLMRLPTEAEWERAARGETQSEFSFDVSGNPTWDTSCGSFPEADGYMVWCGNDNSRAEEVGSKLPNPYGLYDMHGNLYERVEDWYTALLGTAAVTDPTGPETGSYRVVRGGYWNDYARYCRSAYRYGEPPSYRISGIGFRLARSE